MFARIQSNPALSNNAYPVQLRSSSNLQQQVVPEIYSTPQPIWMPWWEKAYLNFQNENIIDLYYVDAAIKGIRQTAISPKFFNTGQLEQIQNEINVLTFISKPNNLNYFFSKIVPVLEEYTDSLQITFTIPCRTKETLKAILQYVEVINTSIPPMARLNKEYSQLKFSLIRSRSNKIFILNNKLRESEKHIAKGENGLLRHAIDPVASSSDLQEIIVKKFHPKSNDLENNKIFIENEVRMNVLLKSRLANLIPLLDAALVPKKSGLVNENSAYIFMPKASADLYEFLINTHNLTETQILRIAAESAFILAKFHESGFYHLDVKLENFLVFKTNENDFQLKICDFALTTMDQNSTYPKGTERFAAPEVMNSEIMNSHYSNEKADVYTFGHVLKDIKELGKAFLNSNSSIPNAYQEIVNYCLAEDPINRPDMRWVLGKLQYLYQLKI